MYSGKTTVIIGLKRALRITPELDSLRSCLGLDGDLSTDLDHLFSLNDRKTRRPVVVAFRDSNSKLEGAVIFFERCLFGVPTGVLRAGDHAGDGAVIAPAGRRGEMLITATELLLKDWRFHAIFGAVSGAAGESPLSLQRPEISNSVALRQVSRRMTLGAGYEETLKLLGRKARHDVRSKRRRFEQQEDVEWVPEISPVEAQEAMTYLTEYCVPPRTKWEIAHRYDFLRKHPSTGISFGIRTKAGQWMSFITGWRAGGVTYVSWAMHDRRYLSHSLGTVIYAYLIEHEAGVGQNTIEWVGGVTQRWSSVCKPEECFCYTRTRRGIRSALILSFEGKLNLKTSLGYYQSELSGASDPGETALARDDSPELAMSIALPARTLPNSAQ